MPSLIELDGQGRDLLIRFDYDARLVDAVRALPGRRFDARNKLWTVPARHVDEVVNKLLPHGFALAPAVREMASGGAAAATAGDDPPFATTRLAPSAPTTPPQTDPTLSVSALNLRVRDTLRGVFRESLWVTGEVLDFDKSAGRRHRFFTLVEKGQGDDPRPIAQVEVALFELKLAELASKLARANPPLALRDGLLIRICARVDFYPQSGRFQLVVDDIDPLYTLGQLALTREQLLRELRAKGLADKNSRLPLPVAPLRLGVLSSESADGWHDFRRQLEGSGFAFAVTLYPVRVQGVALKPTMLAGLAWFAAHAAEFDALCILRGGGSRTDLSGFDDRDLALAVARHPLKVLVGIGHERDLSVLDAIAASFKTPTAVAAFLVERTAEAWTTLDDGVRRLGDAVAELLDRRRERLTRQARQLRDALTSHLETERHGLALALQRVRHGTLTLAQRHAARLAQRAARLTAATQRIADRARARLDNQETRCRLLDPRRVLQRGYAIVQNEQGKIVTEARAVAPGAALSIEFRDGRIGVRAEPPA